MWVLAPWWEGPRDCGRSKTETGRASGAEPGEAGPRGSGAGVGGAQKAGTGGGGASGRGQREVSRAGEVSRPVWARKLRDQTQRW